MSKTEFYREVARKVLIKHRALMDMNDEDAGGIRAMMLMYENIPDIQDAWRAVHMFMIENYPELLDNTPSPDSVLRRLREVRKEMKDNKQSQPALGQ